MEVKIKQDLTGQWRREGTHELAQVMDSTPGSQVGTSFGAWAGVDSSGEQEH